MANPAWLIWRLDVSGDVEKAMQDGLKRYQEKFGRAANRATVSPKMAAEKVALVEKVIGSPEGVKGRGYIFNANEVFIGFEEGAAQTGATHEGTCIAPEEVE